MYNINQFKPTLYILLLVGILGFALAAESPGVWVLGTGGILLNAWLVKTGRFVPLPRLLANVITIGSMLFIAREAFVPNVTPVMVIGKFLVLLQLIKIWEQRANRDYAQLLILSLLLMVAASINTASLIFGILLVVYLFLSLYCCLLFHLKVESDSARAAFAVPEDRMSPGTLRQDERYLTRSMRRLTAFVSAIAIATAVVIFLLFPRGAGAGMFGPMPFRPAQTLTGFSENVSFEQLAKITQSNEKVATVIVTRNGQRVSGAEPLLLRGVALDLYNGRPNATRFGSAWQWVRSPTRFDDTRAVDRGQTLQLEDDPPAGGDRYVQTVQLQPTGTRALFAIAGPVRFTPRRDLKVKFNMADGVLQTEEPLGVPVEYEVASTGVLPADIRPNPSQEEGRVRAERWNRIDPRVRKYALNPDVTGPPPATAARAGAASLGEARPQTVYVHALDEQIARNIEQHLRSTFSYTLDLTDSAKLRREDDPMVEFLYTLKRGHCEYFAGAMALMCQSLGMQARVVNGFKCDEFNEMGGYYIVRQSHAHSWVEVLTTSGWQTFDPTSAREEARSERGLWQQVTHFFNFLEFTYGNAVIAYDNDHRENLIANVESKMQGTTYAGQEWVRSARDWFDRNMYSLSSKAIGGAVALMVAAMFGFVAWFFWERWMLRRRAARIGLDTLPDADQLRLLRQLGFYDELIQLLAKHQITRPKHLTPLEFSQSLLYLPGRAFDMIRRITEVFYRVRYGNYDLSPALQRRLGTVVSQLDDVLGPPPKK
jgi:hypothetical protein